jgi:hypothetical protein
VTSGSVTLSGIAGVWIEGGEFYNLELLSDIQILTLTYLVDALDYKKYDADLGIWPLSPFVNKGTVLNLN